VDFLVAAKWFPQFYDRSFFSFRTTIFNFVSNVITTLGLSAFLIDRPDKDTNLILKTNKKGKKSSAYGWLAKQRK
jgi:hypothetical protein